MTSSAEPDSLESQLRQSIAELERRIHIGDDCRSEEFFAQHPSLAADANTAIELIYAEFAARHEMGQHPPREEYFRRFPKWQTELKRQFDVDEGLGELSKSREIRIRAAAGAPERYQLLKEIWRSANGNVDKAVHIGPNRVVAIKTLVNGDAADVARFNTGAREQARLSHDHILPVHIVGENDDGLPCFAMEFADGGSLARQIGGKPQSPQAAARMVRALADAMTYAHREGVVHRDLKPANILLTADGSPKIADFGLAKRFDSPDGPTATGDIHGTAPYMAPEQAAGRTHEVGPLTDVYALGAILYEMLTGQPPFHGKTAVETISQVLTRVPVRPRRLVNDAPRGLQSICLMCLEKYPQRRFRSAQDLVDDLNRWLENGRPRANALGARLGRIVRRNRLASAAAALLLLAAIIAPVAAYVLSPERERERIERDLATGKEVTLIDDTGHARWHRWATGEPTQKQRVNGGALQIESDRFALLELVHNPRQARYRFSAWVRHNENRGPDSEIGLYFDYHIDKASGLEHHLCSVAFNGMTDRRLQHPDHSGNEVLLNAQRIREPDWARNIWRTGLSLGLPVSWDAIPAWRKIILDVSPEKIAVSVWSNDKAGGVLLSKEVAREKVEQAKMQARTPADRIGTATETVPEATAPELSAMQGSLGLYVHRASASFRQVIISPDP